MMERPGAADAWTVSESSAASPCRGFGSPASPMRNSVVSICAGGISSIRRCGLHAVTVADVIMHKTPASERRAIQFLPCKESINCIRKTFLSAGKNVPVHRRHTRGSRFDQVTKARCRRPRPCAIHPDCVARRSEEHTSELQSRLHLVCRLLL